MLETEIEIPLEAAEVPSTADTAIPVEDIDCAPPAEDKKKRRRKRKKAGKAPPPREDYLEKTQSTSNIDALETLPQ